MRLVELKDCKGGEVLAESIVYNDVVMLKKGAVLNEWTIKALERRDIKQIYVESTSIKPSASQQQNTAKPVKTEPEKKSLLQRLLGDDEKTSKTEEKPKTATKNTVTVPLTQIVEIEVTIDIALPSQLDSPEQIRLIAKDFLNNVDRIGIYPVAFVGDLTNEPMQVEEGLKYFERFKDVSTRYKAFRVTGQKFYIQYYGNNQSSSFKEWYWYKHKKGIFCLKITKTNRRKPTSSRPIFIGKTKPISE